ncbi:unnamed protein product [Rhizoctonia solani]|uniref:F-box domain-containing protein n=1 Tax=Rhizoctonia solani TaxID=456999 RepID=A0A8H3DFM1_9AGAM|nr:unnamed protein product [Rhizoctonia solani]
MLSSEVMSHIFWLSGGEPCPACTEYRPETPYPYPNVLLQVCSRWRQIALASPNLWSHIGLNFSTDSPARSHNLVKRAHLFVMRSKEAPLELHISTEFGEAIEGLAGLCGSVAPRLRSLELETRDDLKQVFSHGQLWLAALISGFTPGTPTRLNWKSRGGNATFLTVVDSVDTGHPRIRIPVVEEQLEDYLASVTCLQLENVYPFWTSRAYHGLVELSLDGGRNTSIQIKCLELEGIMKASPGLQILRFGLDVVLEEEHSGYPQVELNDLKSLWLTSGSSQRAVFNMLHLGRNPLELTIDATKPTYSALVSSSWVDFYDFAARSNITLLRIQCVKIAEFSHDTNFDPLQLLHHLPQLEVLVLDSLRFGQLQPSMGHFLGRGAMRLLPAPVAHDPSPFNNRLQLLRLKNCVAVWTDLRRTLEMRLAEKVEFNGSYVLAHDSEEAEVQARLRRNGLFVELNESKPQSK